MGLFNFLKEQLSKLIKKPIVKKEIERTPGTTDIPFEPVSTENKATKEIDNQIETRIIHISPNVYLVSKAARLCIGKDELDTYENRINHIQKLMKRGHESILEHSNVVSLIRIPIKIICQTGIDLVYDLMDILIESRYLHITQTRHNGYINILISGSIRGYLNIVREVPEVNRALYLIKDIIYQSIEKEFLTSLIDNNLIDEDKCTYRPPSRLKTITSTDEDGEEVQEVVGEYKEDPKVIKGKHVDILSFCHHSDLRFKLDEYGFESTDIYGLSTITFLVHDISRAIGNQLVRHRVGLTQESQRYVKIDGDNIDNFVDPIKINDEYDKNKYKHVNKEYFYDGLKPFQMYQFALANHLTKEDARYWLPLGTKTKVMMTFTNRQLEHFIKLRAAKDAQLEIRNIANEMSGYTGILTDDNAKVFGVYDDKPNYKALRYRNKNSNIEEGNEDQKIKIDEEADNIETQEEEIQPLVPTKAEDIKSLDINTVEDAERYLRESEELKKL